MITDINQLDFSKQYTYADYLMWQFKERVELFRGWVAKMSSTTTQHQMCVTRFMWALLPYFQEEKLYHVFAAPFDVTLPDSKKKDHPRKTTTVVQPDLCVVCDATKLNRRGCHGAPDWVIEILSPGNSKKEIDTKYRLYEEAGVREYWLVDMSNFAVTVFELKGEVFVFRKMYASDATVPSGIFEGFAVNLTQIFTEEDMRRAEFPEEDDF